MKLIETSEFPTAVVFEFRALRPVNLTHVTWRVHSPENDDNLSDFVPQKVADRYISLARRHGYYFDPQAGPMKEWPLEEEPDIQLELSGRGWSSEILISDEGGQAFAPRLGPTMCTALALPGYIGRGPEFTPEGYPITYVPDDNGAAALIKTDGTSTLLTQW